MIHLKSWGVYTEECGILLITQWKLHKDEVVRITCWQISSFEVIEFLKGICLLLICLTSSWYIQRCALLRYFPLDVNIQF